MHLNQLRLKFGRRSVNRTRTNHEVTVVDSVDAVSRSKWNDIVDRSPRASVFHRYGWNRAVEIGLDYTPRHFVVEKDGNLIGLFPNYVRELPKTPFRRLSSVHPGYGGPLLPTDVQTSLPLVVDEVSNRSGPRTVVHEIRAADTDYLRYSDALQSRGYRPHLGECRHQIDLRKGRDRILEEMSRSRRRDVERGLETDHEIVEEDVTEANIQRFYRTYERTMERLDGDAYPLAFFEALREMRDRLLLVTLRLDGEYAGGMLELLDDEQSTVYGFVAAVPREYYDVGASELLYDHVIRWGIENGYRTYDLGSSRPDYEDGLFMYKDGFGGRAVPSLSWERGLNPFWRAVALGRRKYVEYQR